MARRSTIGDLAVAITQLRDDHHLGPREFAGATRRTHHESTRAAWTAPQIIRYTVQLAAMTDAELLAETAVSLRMAKEASRGGERVLCGIAEMAHREFLGRTLAPEVLAVIDREFGGFAELPSGRYWPASGSAAG